MKTHWRITLAVGLALVLICLPPGPAPAQGQGQPPPSRAIDVVIVLDDSGSVATCSPWKKDETIHATSDCAHKGYAYPPSDLNNLRYSAAHLLVQLADDDDRIAVIRFDTRVEQVGTQQLQRVGGPDNRTSLIARISPPNEYDSRGYTRIDLGLKRAADILLARTEADRPGYVLLMTDGAPTQPMGTSPQDRAVESTVAQLRRRGVQIFPVALCNGDCPSSFLKNTISIPREARTANDLLRVFSDVFAEMKPNLHVIDRRNADGDIEWFTRLAHGAHQFNIVTAKDGFVSLANNGRQESTEPKLQDGNIVVNVVERSVFPEGKWTVKTRQSDGFVVVRTDTYPELIHPPISGNPAAPRYVPAGKPPLIAARVIGPGGSEPILLDATTPLKPLTADTRWIQLPSSGSFTLQVGADTEPLQIRRRFSIESRKDLPLAQAPAPTCVAATPCPLIVEFPPGPEVSDLKASVYIADAADETKLEYAQSMACTGRQCTDSGFQPEDGRAYLIRFLVQGRSGDVLFGDWAETPLAMRPAIYVRGLPNPLDLKTQPPGGWPVTIIASTTEDLGRLHADLSLARTDDKRPAEGVRVLFGADIRGHGEQQTTLRIEGIDRLPPGNYSGQLTFTVERQATAAVQMPSPIPLSLFLERPTASLSQSSVDFGSVLFDPSPNFRLSQEYSLPIQYSDKPFQLSPEILEDSCPDLKLKVIAEAAEPQSDGKNQIKLRLVSDQRPQTASICSGKLTLLGPSPDYKVEPPAPLSWRVEIRAIEWEIVGAERTGGVSSDLIFSDMGKAGERGTALLLVRYNGKPPFAFRMDHLSASDDHGQNTINQDDVTLEMSPPVELPNQPGIYRVPIALIPRHELSAGLWFDSHYSGNMVLRIEEVPDAVGKTVQLRFTSPSWRTRYIAPWFRFWWPGCFTIGVPALVAVALLKRRADRAYERKVREIQGRARSANQSPGPLQPPGGATPGRRSGGLSNGPPGGGNATGRPPAPRPGEPPGGGNATGRPPAPRPGGPPGGSGVTTRPPTPRPGGPPGGGNTTGRPPAPRPGGPPIGSGVTTRPPSPRSSGGRNRRR